MAEINPRPPRLADDTEVSFVGMAGLNATSAATESDSVCKFSAVNKGYTVFADGDILVAKITPCFENSKIGQARLHRAVGVGSTEFHVIRPGECLDDRYVLHFLRQDRIRRQGEIRMTGSGGQRRVPAAFLSELPILLPPLDEQRRIAAILDRADDTARRQRSVLSELDHLEQSVFRELFGDPSEWRNRWPMGCIGDMAEGVQYGTSSKAGNRGEWPVVRMGNVTDAGRLDLSDLKWIDLPKTDVPKFTLKRGDLLFNRTNSKEKVGKTCVVATDQPLAFAGYLVRVRLRPEHQSAFVNAFMTSRYGQALRKGMAKTAVNQANINATEMKSIPIAMPPSELQREFATTLIHIDAERDRQLLAIGRSRELFASLQARAFRGELTRKSAGPVATTSQNA